MFETMWLPHGLSFDFVCAYRLMHQGAKSGWAYRCAVIRRGSGAIEGL